MPSTDCLSILVICLNEADRLGATLEAVQGLASEIVVVDAGSTDGTQDLARRHGARVIHNVFPGYGEQKRFAEDQCSGRWLLNIDADEVVSPELYREIQALFENGEPSNDAYEIPIAEVFPGRNRPHKYAWSLAPVRLYRADAGRYSASPVHDRVELVDGARVARLAGKIHHFSVRSMGDQIAKLNRYTDMQVDDLIARGRKVSALRLVTEFPMQFLKAYIGRRHCLYGLYGIATAANHAYARHLRVAKFIERERVKDQQEQGKQG